MIESTLDGELMDLGIDEQPLVTLLSYVVVSATDPAFENPSKPIGPAFGEEASRGLPYPTVKTAKGYRRVVASPEPLSIVERAEIRRLVAEGFIVIACGGGGIPVIRGRRTFQGVDAVIDKDLASARLAEEVGVDIFCMVTDVPGVAVDFGGPGERTLRRITTTEARARLAAGEFPAGSMGPKVEAAVRFLGAGGGRAVIASIESVEAAVAGEAGTEFFSG
jgi:carbamate kinase